MGYINVTKKELPPETYINLGLKHKLTVTTQERWFTPNDINLYTNYSSYYNMNIDNDCLLTGFSNYTYAYIPQNVYNSFVSTDGFVVECSFPTPPSGSFQTIWKLEGVSGIEFNGTNISFYNYTTGRDITWALDSSATKHYVRNVCKPNGEVEQFYSTDGINYVSKGINYENGLVIDTNSPNLIIGNHDGIMSRYFRGSTIDLKDFKIKNYTTDTYVWECYKQNEGEY